MIAAVVLAADQVTKTLALEHLMSGPRHLLGPVSLQLEYNRGVAFSLLNGVGAPVLAIVVAVIALVGLFASKVSGALGTIGAALVLGGAFGNLADRLFRSGGAVVDFVHTSFWPTFNVADSAIVLGGVLLAFAFWRGGAPAGER